MTDREERPRMLNDDEATVNIGAVGGARMNRPSDTRMLPDSDVGAQALADEARIRAQEKAARQKALGTVPVTDDDVALPPPERDHNDRFLGSIALFLLRVVLAAMLGVRGVQVLFEIDGTTSWLTDHHVPQASIVVWALGIGLIIIAALLLIGFGVRLASIVITALAVAMLVWVQWGYQNVFVQGQAGFIGDLDLLVAAAGATLAFLGSGGWAIDAAMRYDRAKRRQYL